MIKFAGVV